MFVTASLLDPAGQPLVKADEEGDIVAVPSAAGVASEAIPGDALSSPLPQ
jgi:hypothetical protein